jgi:ribosomal protein S27AE
LAVIKSLMTKQEFISKQQTMNKAVNKRLAFWLVFFFAALLSGIPLSDYIERHEQNYRWIGAVSGIALLAFLLANVAAMAWYGLRQQKRLGHRCPRCGKALIGFLVQIAIATSNCSHCGERVFAET